jgi:hypothetical protein
MAQDNKKPKSPEVQARINQRVNFVKSRPNLDPYEARKRFFVQTRVKELEAAGKPVDRKALRNQFDTGKVKREGFYTPADLRKFGKGTGGTGAGSVGTGGTGSKGTGGKGASSTITGGKNTSTTSSRPKGDEAVRPGRLGAIKPTPSPAIPTGAKKNKGMSGAQKVGIGIAAYTVVQGLKAWDASKGSVVQQTLGIGPGQMPGGSNLVPVVGPQPGSPGNPIPLTRGPIITPRSNTAIPLPAGRSTPLALPAATGSSSAPAVRTAGVPSAAGNAPRDISYKQFVQIVRTPPPKGAENARAQWIKQYPEYAAQLVREIKEAESGARVAVQNTRTQARDTVRRWFGSGGVGGFNSPSGGPGNSGVAGGVRGGGGAMLGRGK